jgi:hypothetical protein
MGNIGEFTAHRLDAEQGLPRSSRWPDRQPARVSDPQPGDLERLVTSGNRFRRHAC